MLFFDCDYWLLASFGLQQKAVNALSRWIASRDLDGRAIGSLMLAANSSEYLDIRSDALRLLLDVVASRNSAVSFPRSWMASLSEVQFRQVDAFQNRLKKLSSRSLISKYPSFSFEVADLEAFYDAYMKRPQEDVKIKRTHKICTLGSCFAINIARHLSAHGFNARSFELGELVNNTYTNLFVLRNDVEDNADWVKLQPQMAHQVSLFKRHLSDADVVIITLGLGLAFFASDGTPLRDPLYSFRREHYKGYNMKPIPIDQNLENLGAIIEEIKSINPKCKIIATLSPVPLDGCKGGFASAVEADCISKSVGRLTLALAEASGMDFCYFPSFELVRWVACSQSIPVFGGDIDDCYLRHPTASIIESIMKIFVSYYCEPGDGSSDS